MMNEINIIMALSPVRRQKRLYGATYVRLFAN